MTNYQKALASIPMAAVGDVDGNTIDDLAACIETQLELIAEGQDGTEEYTKRDITAMKNWLKKWKGKA